jgi:hypothetical protein
MNIVRDPEGRLALKINNETFAQLLLEDKGAWHVHNGNLVYTVISPMKITALSGAGVVEIFIWEGSTISPNKD